MVSVNTLEGYLKVGANILLQGPHGVGKTQMLMQACEALGYTLAYYSTSTLDPYTDLVGIPVPTEITINGKKVKVLESIRPRRLDEADVIFFDELNRAEPKTLNAVFEITQFGTINGEKLPNLKAVVGAQNPPEDDYQVNPLDPAFLDRFDFFINVEAKPDKSYLISSLTKDFTKKSATTVVNALITWHKDHLRGSKNFSYISPRRIEGIGRMILTLQNENYKNNKIKEAVDYMMPPGDKWDTAKLIALALGDESANPDNSDFDFSKAEKEWVRTTADVAQMVTWFNQATQEQKDDYLLILRSTRPHVLLGRFLPVLTILTERDVKYMVGEEDKGGWMEAKREILKSMIDTKTDAEVPSDVRQNLVKWLTK